MSDIGWAEAKRFRSTTVVLEAGPFSAEVFEEGLGLW